MRAYIALLGTIMAASYVAAVIQPPKIEQGPISMTFRQHDPVTMNCKASGLPHPSYYWEKDGVHLDLKEEGYYSLGGGSFEILDASTADTGSYQCFAENKYGTTMSQIVLVKASEFDKNVDTQITEYEGTEGDHLVLNCKSLNSYPTPSISWVMTSSVTDTESTPVSEDDRVFIDHDGYLHFAHLEAGDANNNTLYKCNRYNDIEDTTRGGSYSRVKVNPGTGESVEVELKYSSPSPTTVFRGDPKVKLQCFYSGNATVLWRRKDGEPLHEKLNATETLNTLTFRDIVDDHEGEYQCYLQENENITETIQLNVQGKPAWLVLNKEEQRPVDVNVTEGGEHAFVCAGDGKPAVTTTWYINAKKVDSLTPAPGVEITEDKKTMTVSDVQLEREDGSTSLMAIQCVIENKHGVLVGDAYLNVKWNDRTTNNYNQFTNEIAESGRPMDWVLVYGEPVIFDCSVDYESNVPLKVTWYWRGRPVDLEHKAFEKLRNNSLIITTKDEVKLGAEFEGEYECVADNGYTQDSASAKLILPEGPIPARPVWIVVDGVEQKLTNVNVTRGGTHVYYCDAEGFPKPETTWYIDAKAVDSLSPRPGILISDDLKTMTAYDVQRDPTDGSQWICLDVMNVQCSVENEYGILISRSALKVLVPTKIEAGGEPKDFRLVPSRPVMFNCDASSDPRTTLRVTWRHNGLALDFDDPAFTQLPNNSLLIITENMTKLGVEMAGVYECYADNGYSHVSQRAELILPQNPIKIRRPPSIDKGPSSGTFRAKSRVVLTCEASGAPDPAYYWEKDGERFVTDCQCSCPCNKIHSETGGTFEISEITLKNAGTYQCFAYNKYGTTMSQKVKVDVSVLGRVEDRGVTDYEGTEGEYLKVNGAPVESYPPARYNWVVTESEHSEQHEEIEESDRVFVDHEGNLHIGSLDLADTHDGHLYKCYIYNNIEDAVTGGAYSTINVTKGTGEPVPIKLQYSSPSPITVLRGDSEVHLKCFFSGHPTPGPVQWRHQTEKEGNETENNGNNDTRTSADKANTLTLMDIRDDDEGDYLCYPSADENITATINLIVEAAPSWMIVDGVEQRPADINVTVGESHTFVCSGDGKPAVTTTWYIDAKEVESHTPRAGVEINEDNKTMTVSDVMKQREDGTSSLMSVQCAIENKHGSLIGSGYINVLVPTKIPEGKGPRHWHLVPGEPVIFNCEAESDPSTPVAISWFKDEQPINLDKPEFNQLSNNSLKITTSNLPRRGRELEGKYRCVADNGYSQDKAEAFLTVPGGVLVAPVSPGGGADSAKPMTVGLLVLSYSLLWLFIVNV